ncbi:response regulator transcription factor [Nocardioides sp. zg-1308]|uniref:response regulator n=1 Tax=Nocardioides sp. zg-1308 TaxID=2736253 RepID=UPI0015528C60|nr:response regulator transcription factor [Nocardioides sp. zg-1308]
MTSVVVVDDQEMVRAGLRVMLESRGVTVAGEAADGRAGIEAVRRLGPDVCLMDIRMPVLDGIEATRLLVAEGSPTRVLVLTTYDLDELVHAALRHGAAGFLLKTTPAARLVEGVDTVARGEALLAPELTRRLIEQHVARPAPGSADRLTAGLTRREREVLVLVGEGRSNDEIGATLFVSRATVKSHVNRVFAKLGITSRVQAVVLCYEHGLVVPGQRTEP